MSPRHVTRHAAALLGAISTMLTACAERPTSSDTGSPPTNPSTADSTAATAASAPPPIEPTPAVSNTVDPDVFAPAPSSSEGGASAAPTKSSPPPRPPPPPRPKKKPPGWVEGRPFLVHGQARLAGTAEGDGWIAAIDVEVGALSERERSALSEHYTKWALAEHASVASFARFTLQLMALGAPADLVQRAIAAADDEVRHARFGFALASRVAGHPITPTQLAVDDALGTVTLEQTLRLAVVEGMIGETIAALEAHVAADVAGVPGLPGLLKEIANDESRHAELAYAFAAWALLQQPHLASVIAEEIAAWAPPSSPGRAGLAPWGVLDAHERERIHEQGFATVVKPLVSQLASVCGAPAACPDLEQAVHRVGAHA